MLLFLSLQEWGVSGLSSTIFFHIKIFMLANSTTAWMLRWRFLFSNKSVIYSLCARTTKIWNIYHHFSFLFKPIKNPSTRSHHHTLCSTNDLFFYKIFQVLLRIWYWHFTLCNYYACRYGRYAILFSWTEDFCFYFTHELCLHLNVDIHWPTQIFIRTKV